MSKRVWALLLVCMMMLGLGTAAQAEDALFQVSTLNALMLGLYDGVLPGADFLRYGDTGLGTVDRLDGEMIAVDGVLYQVRVDGSVHVIPPEATIPFGVITALEADYAEDLAAIDGVDALMAYLDALPPVAENPNRIYVARVDGSFAGVRTRSVAAQEAPYPKLSEVTQAQAEFDLGETDGTLVGVYFPDYLAGVNMHGWHLHFLSADKARGGHVLAVSVVEGRLVLDEVEEFVMLMPDSEAFAGAALAEDMRGEILSVEK